MRRKSLWMSIGLNVALVLAPVMFVSGCSSGAGDQPAASQMTAEVTITKVARANIRLTAPVSGNVVALPNKDVKVSSLVAGRITSLNVAEGDRVRAGEVLATIDARAYQDQLRKAQAAVAQAQATVQNAQQNVTRYETLFKRGIVAGKTLEDAKTALSVAQGAERQAAASQQASARQLEQTKIRSPLTGVVAKRFASIGEQVDGTATQPIVEVANIAQVELSGNLPASYLAKIHLGEMLPVTSDALPGDTFDGRIVAISPSVDPATNVGSIRIRIANPKGTLKLGMYLNAQVPVETHANALTVPPQAIYHDAAGNTRVYEVVGDTAKAVNVKLGIDTKDRVQILSGVTAGETIVLDGGYGLGETTKIKIKS
ncbi:MAG TPA: efflux RND transporter periplasmic adaptor subunit [Candidatus Acidoferrales bacterium]|nr:efflux RND transporter periplasmic adaptor subunit [Candidatus Acidoferrales bacterium]